MNVRPFIFFAIVLIVSGSVSAQTEPAEIWATDARYSSGTFSESDGSREVNGYDCNRGIQSDRIELDSIKGDSFCVSDTDADTWKWDLVQTDTGESFDRQISAGNLSLRIETNNAGGDALGIGSRTTYSGDWDYRIWAWRSLAGGVVDMARINVLNEKISFCTGATVDGIFYDARVGSGANTFLLFAFTCVNGVQVLIGSTTDSIQNPIWLRMSQRGVEISWWYSIDGMAWTLDERTILGSALNTVFYIPTIIDIGDDAIQTRFNMDDFYISSGTLDSGGYRDGGTWNTSAFEVDSPQRVGWIDYNHALSAGASCIENVTLLDNGDPIEYWQASFPLGVCAPPVPPLEALSNVTADDGITVSFTFFGDGNQTISVRYIAVTKVMVDTSSLTFLILFLIVFLFIVGIFHEAFWFVCALVCFIAASEFTALYPNTLWAFVFVVMGIMLIVLMFARATGAKLGIRVVKT